MRGSDRRQYTRFVLPSMYTDIAVRLFDNERFDLLGHAYDLSEGGMRFELDRPIEPGTQIGIRIVLPHSELTSWSERRPIFATGHVVWVHEDDIELPGPVRLACTFRRFMQPGDRERICRQLTSGRYSMAA